MGKIAFKFFFGALAGLTAWLIMEPTAPKTLDAALAIDPQWERFEVSFILLMGAMIGGVVGLIDGWLQGSRWHAVRGFILGAVFGVIGIFIGRSVGALLSQAIFGTATIGLEQNLLQKIAWRIVVLFPMGSFLGLAIGASTLNLKRAIQGLIGGTIAGLIGGGVFDFVGGIVGGAVMAARGQQVGETGIVSRALYAILLGAFIGMFIGIVEQVARSAWVRLRLGRNEGKEWVVDAHQTFIGRSERAQIPLFGDQNVAPMHACIVHQGPNYMLMDGGSPAGTFLNGQRIQQAPLFPGAQIQVGGYVLEFFMKAGVAARSAEQLRSQQATYPMMSHQPYLQPAAQASAAPAPQPAAQVPQPAQPVLVAMSGPITGQRFPVGGVLEIGREASGIALSFDSMASRRHATVATTANGILLTDLNSTNGTFVNEQRVQSTTLRPGDIVRIGTTAFRVE